MDNNGSSFLGLLLVVAHPDSWPAWMRQVVGGATVVLVTSFIGTSLALWKEQAIILEKLQAISESSALSRQLLQQQILSNDRDIEEVRRSTLKAHERISTHVENHGGPKAPK